MHYLSVEEILRLYFQVIKDFGGSHGVRDENGLKSVVDAPKQVVFGQEQYSSLYERAAVYVRNIIGDHPFVDGNKRTAVTVGGIFMSRNGHKLIAEPKELEDFAVAVATEHLDVSAIAAWLKAHSSK
jgi:death on curing protein